MTFTDKQLVDCSLCGTSVLLNETCSTGACRACHKSLTLEECRGQLEKYDQWKDAGATGPRPRIG